MIYWCLMVYINLTCGQLCPHPNSQGISSFRLEILCGSKVISFIFLLLQFFNIDCVLHLQALFLSLYKNFSTVLTERLPDASRAGTFQELKSIYAADSMAVDVEESSEMEVDNENGRPKKRFCSPPHWKEKARVILSH